MYMTTKIIVKWVIIVIVAIAVILVATLLLAPGLLAGPTAAPLQLPQLSTTTSASTTSPDGTWIAGSGSVAGFRVNESFLTQSGVIVGRTSAVTGSLVILNNQISSGSFQADLSQLTMGGKQNESFLKLLNTSTYPSATLTLTSPVILSNIPNNSQTISSEANGSLTIDGITHPVTFTFTASYNGSVLEATGSAPILASDWSIKSPFGIHNNDVIEFLLVLGRE
jgi:polyisoprenoid-binding protein YceI